MNKFADYFVICGLDYNSGLEPDRFADDNLHSSPLERPYKGKVLAHYPDNVPSNPFDASAVCLLCLPSGLRFRTQKHSVTQVPIFHSFLITREDGKRCYGFSLVFYEEVRNRDICNAMQTLQAMYVTELSSGIKVKAVQHQTPQSRSLPRHFKLSTPASGGVLTYYDISKDRLFVSKSIGILCQIANVQAAKIFLENLYKKFIVIVINLGVYDSDYKDCGVLTAFTVLIMLDSLVSCVTEFIIKHFHGEGFTNAI